MRLWRKTLTATGVILLPLDFDKVYLDYAYSLYGDQAISGATAQVDSTLSDINANTLVTVSRSTTVVTVTFPSNHFLGTTADYIVIKGSGVSSIDGVYQVASVPNTTTVTYTSSVSGTVAAIPARAAPLKMHGSIVASGSVTTTATTTNAIIPHSALILNVTALTGGTVVLDALQVGLK